jgi:hypothetical protein
MKNLINKFASLKSATFISINNYLASTSGELADHVVNVNISVKNAKEADLKKLQAVTPADLKAISQKSKIDFETVSQAYSELLTSAVRNLSEDKEDRTAQSQAQSDAYIFLTPAIRLHKETLTIHVFGQAISKHVIVEGQYKPVKSAPKTIAKNLIKKSLDMRSDKFRDFILGNADMLQVAGDTILIVR